MMVTDGHSLSSQVACPGALNPFRWLAPRDDAQRIELISEAF